MIPRGTSDQRRVTLLIALFSRGKALILASEDIRMAVPAGDGERARRDCLPSLLRPGEGRGRRNQTEPA